VLSVEIVGKVGPEVATGLYGKGEALVEPMAFEVSKIG